jgi:hypothetical protein
MTKTLKQIAADLGRDDPNEPVHRYVPPADLIAPKPQSRELATSSRTKYAAFFDGLDEYLRDGDVPADAMEASATTRTHIQHIHKAMDLAENASQKAADEYRMERTPTFKTNDDARAKLKAMTPRQVINVDYSMAPTIRSLCSYYNSKENGPRFETRRAPSNPNILQIKRTK